MEYDVQIVQLPIKHCALNPIELAWAQFKAYVRTNNNEDTSVRFIEHARKADNFMEEEMEPNLVDDDNEDIDPHVYLDSADDDDGC